jgi:sucrose-6-phosphate hydrolase SacC (GH32 family)
VRAPKAGDLQLGNQRYCDEDDGTSAVTLRYDGKMLDAAGTKVPLQLDNDGKTLTLHVFLDRSVMEVFAGGGRECITRVIYPGEEDLGIEVFPQGGTARLESMDVWKMKSIR